jgi:hypothetical protein
LVHVLIGKSMLETILVGALAVFSFLQIAPPYFHGWGEVSDTGISGWVVNNAQPFDRVEVQLFVDGRFVASRRADEARPDVMAAGWSRDEFHGYTFSKPASTSGRHEARIYAVHESGGGLRKTLQQVGDPIAFSAAPDGTIRHSATP